MISAVVLDIVFLASTRMTVDFWQELLFATSLASVALNGWLAFILGQRIPVLWTPLASRSARH